MKKNLLEDIKRINKIDPTWLAIWLIIYLLFLVLDLLTPGFWGSALIKYIGIFLCLIYAYQKFPTDHLLILALLFTFLADTILIWTDWEVPGVFSFCFAQFFHTARFASTHPQFLLLYFLAIFLVFVFAIIQGVAPIYAISAIYAIGLFSNLVLSFSWFRREPANFHARCAFLGFVLFVACDLSVATQHLILDGILPLAFLPLVSYLVWLFYYPSQVLISNSSNNLPKTVVVKK